MIRILIVTDRGTAMGTPLKLLAVGLVLATAAMAGCSSTTGSSGAVQDDASSAASPTSSSAGPTSSAAPVTPTAAPTEETSSPVASPTDIPDDPALVGGRENNDVCEVVPNPVSGLTYTCGDTGPGGGTIYYASSTAFACGPEVALSCNYLEVAQNLWAPKSQNKCTKAGGKCGGSATQTSDFAGSGKGITLCTGPQTDASILDVSRGVVGAGYANTMVLVPLCSPSDAPNIARAYDGGDMTDWFVPSMYELQALYQYPNRNAIGGFPNNVKYWMSTSGFATLGEAIQFSSNNAINEPDRDMGLGFRPVRAF